MAFPDFASPEQIWSSYDNFVFDADGVLWTGIDPVPRATELLGRLKEAGKRIFVVSNNSTKSSR